MTRKTKKRRAAAKLERWRREKPLFGLRAELFGGPRQYKAFLADLRAAYTGVYLHIDRRLRQFDLPARF